MIDYACGLITGAISGELKRCCLNLLVLANVKSVRLAQRFGSIWLTSKVSDTVDWRRACESMICDRQSCSLYRVVRPIFLTEDHARGELRDFLGNELSARDFGEAGAKEV